MNFAKNLPDRKWLASGVSGVLTWAIVTYAGLGEEVATPLVGAVMAAVHYFVPPSVTDIIKRVDDQVIKFARQSPDSPASPE